MRRTLSLVAAATWARSPLLLLLLAGAASRCVVVHGFHHVALAPRSTIASRLRPRVGSTGTLLRADSTSSSSTASLVGLDNTEEEDFDAYSRCLSPREARKQVADELTGRYAIVDERPKWVRALRKPFTVAKKLVGKTPKPGALILLRCGESEWSKNQTFTGWADPELTDEGVQECEHAARLLLAEGYQPDVVFASRLKRSIHSVWSVLYELDQIFLPVYNSWRLNERFYGALTGLSKPGAAMSLGADVVQAWRNSLKARPPPISKTDPYYPGHDPRYSDLTEDQIPLTESLLDCMFRVQPLWDYKIKKELKKGNNVLVVAHTNTLRGLMKIIDDIPDENINEVSMPSGIPFVYKFDSKTMKPLSPREGALSQKHTSGTFLEKPGLLKEALKRQEGWKGAVPGLKDTDEADHVAKRETTLEKALLRLKREQDDEQRAFEEYVSENAKYFDQDSGSGMKLLDESADGSIQLVSKASTKIKISGSSTGSSSSSVHSGAAKETATKIPRWSDDFEYDEEYDFFATSNKDEAKTVANIQPLLEDKSTATESGAGEDISDATAASIAASIKKDDDAVVVLIRHGRTPHNNLGLFTGWEDPPLAKEGVQDARDAGKLLKRHGFQFDVVYTSHLTRAIETAWYALLELNLTWLPIVKSWRLNERMYGELTGKSKSMVANIYGEEQLKKWRRGFKIRPPPTSSYSLSYPGNDYRRTKYVKDLRISMSETISRSLAERKLQVHRKFPKTESLYDCMQRSIPFYTERIIPEAVQKGKRVLITSHENALRGILMHLCDIPVEAMNQLHLPNGLPLVYSVKGKCISLLDDGSGQDPMDVHDFGPAAKYLFRPCELTDDFFDEMEQKGKQMEQEQKQKQEKVEESKQKELVQA